MGCSVPGMSHAVSYQDVWLDGKVVIQGGRECEVRYHAIRKFFKSLKLKRPIKVLDVGANMGYFSFRLSEEFPGCYVMVEGDPQISRCLLKLCKLHRNPSIEMLDKRLTMKDLKNLAERESFDVVLALSVVHHFEEPYQEVFEAFRTLGSYLILEPPVPAEKTSFQTRTAREPLLVERYPHKVLLFTSTGSKINTFYKRPTYVFPCKELSFSFTAFTSESFNLFNGVFPSNYI